MVLEMKLMLGKLEAKQPALAEMCSMATRTTKLQVSPAWDASAA